MKKILVVVDMQKNFIGQCRADSLLPRVSEKIRREEGYEVLFTVDDSGGELDRSIAEWTAHGAVYRKHTYGCKQLILDLAEKNPERVEFIGVCTDICVIANLLGLMDFLPFCEISVDASCCASTQPEGHEAALRVMKACKIEVL